MMKNRSLFSAFVLASWCASACSDTDSATTQLLIKVSAQSRVAARLERVTATLLPVAARSRGDASHVQEFKLSHSEPGAGEVSLPFSFGIAKGEAKQILLVVEGYESRAAGAPIIIERKLVAAFEDGVSREIELQLSDACADSVCESLQATCDAAAHGCVDVASGAPLDAGVDDAGMDAGPVTPTSEMRVAKADAGAKKPTGTKDPVKDMTAANKTPVSTEPADDRDAGPDTTLGVCDQSNVCDGTDYPCVPNTTGGYTCQGQFADWPMPDTAAGPKAKPSYDYTSKPEVVLDKTTQLEWQRMVPKSYPGCSGNEAAPGDTCTWPEAKNYCQQLDLAGGGWRLPSKIELESLQGDTKSIPAIDFAAFPDLSGGQVFWTRSTWMEDLGWAWVVRSGMSTSLPEDQTMTRNVRCVRGGALASGLPRDHYRVNAAQESVTDTHTQLEWQRRYGDVDTLDAAREYCANLGTGWRLPGLNELLSLIDPTRSQPAIHSVFPALPSGGMFWTATPMVAVPDMEPQNMVVNFDSGMSGGERLFRSVENTVRFTFHARCVR